MMLLGSRIRMIFYALDGGIASAIRPIQLQGLMQILRAPRLLILSSASWYSSNLYASVTIPLTLIFPLSRYAIALGKQYVCEKEPIICPPNESNITRQNVTINTP